MWADIKLLPVYVFQFNRNYTIYAYASIISLQSCKIRHNSYIKSKNEHILLQLIFTKGGRGAVVVSKLWKMVRDFLASKPTKKACLARKQPKNAFMWRTDTVHPFLIKRSNSFQCFGFYTGWFQIPVAQSWCGHCTGNSTDWLVDEIYCWYNWNRYLTWLHCFI